MTARPATQPPDLPITRHQLAITGTILVGLLLAALDFSVVGTAMPTIIGQLGGLSEYSWVFTGYVLAATTPVPVFSKLADMYGRRPIFLFGLIVFVFASVLCGLADSMGALIAFRVLQGLGAGALQPVAFTIVGDIYTPAQRAKVQGLFSAVWGGTAIVGPAIGGLITTTIGWPWVFFINVPVGIVAIVLFMRVYHESFAKVAHTIDWAGAALLTGGIGLLLLTLTEGGEVFGYASIEFVALLALSAAILLLFLYAERRAIEPLIDFTLLDIPVISSGLAIGSLLGVVMFGLTTYVPALVQGVQGGSPVEAGVAMAAMSIGWPIGAMLGGRLLLHFGTRRIVLIGSAITVAGAGIATQMPNIDLLWFAMVATGVTGFGMGLTSTTIMVSVQGSVAWNRRGVATGLTQFSRSIGGAIGLGLMGGILAASVGSVSDAILDPFARNALPPAQLAAAEAAMAGGLSVIFWIIFGASVGAAITAWLRMPSLNIRELRQGRPLGEAEGEAIEASLALESGVEFG